MENTPKQPWDWYKNTIAAPGQPKEGRSLDAYEGDMGFAPESLEGKKILDLGAHHTARFATSLAERGINAEVISLSPDYITKEYREKLGTADAEGQHVAALGQELPFGDATFDVVVSMRMLEHIPDRENYVQIIKEIIRVLKPGGVAYLSPIFPVSWDNDTSFDHRINESDEAITEHASVIVEDIDTVKRVKRVSDNMGNYLGDFPIQRVVIRKK